MTRLPTAPTSLLAQQPHDPEKTQPYFPHHARALTVHGLPQDGPFSVYGRAPYINHIPHLMSDLLPPNATDAERALSIAVRPEIPVPLRTLWNPYQCPANVLPWLAWALSVDEWDATWPETTQRQTIAASISQHKIKGTVGAVKSALLRGLGRTVEINENTGVPYTFGIRVQLLAGESSGGAIGGELMERARSIVAKTKNARSELVDESYFTEGGTAAIYTGAAMLNGSEVEIKGEPTPLPLDGMDLRLLGSFWTVRMSTEYNGPLAKVSRDSDSATLAYYTTSELKAFVGAGTWKYLGLYHQGSKAAYAPATYEMVGQFDADGNPYATTYVLPAAYFALEIPASLYPAYSMCVCGKNEDGEVYPAVRMEQLNIYGQVAKRDFSNQAAYFNALTALSFQANASGTSASFTEAVGGRFYANTNVSHDGDGLATNSTAGSRAITAKTLRLFINASNYEPSDARLYGGAFWSYDIGSDAMSEIVQDINSRLNF